MTPELLSLVAALITASAFTVPIAFPLAAGVIAGRERWAWTAAAAAAGIVFGLVLAVVTALLGAAHGFAHMVGIGATIIHLIAVLAAAGCSVLLIRRPDAGGDRRSPSRDGERVAGEPGPGRLGLALGLVTGLLLGLGEEAQIVPALFGLTASPHAVILAIATASLALTSATALLVMLSWKSRTVELGIAVAALTAAVLLLPALGAELLNQISGIVLFDIPAWLIFIGVPAVFVIATSAAALIGTRITRTPRQPWEQRGDARR